jgi:hypothetical protein
MHRQLTVVLWFNKEKTDEKHCEGSWFANSHSSLMSEGVHWEGLYTSTLYSSLFPLVKRWVMDRLVKNLLPER